MIPMKPVPATGVARLAGASAAEAATGAASWAAAANGQTGAPRSRGARCGAGGEWSGPFPVQMTRAPEPSAAGIHPAGSRPRNSSAAIASESASGRAS